MAIQCEPEDRPQPEPYIDTMRRADIPAVIDIERRSFPTPWSQRAFEAELRDNHYAHYIVARIGDDVAGYAGMWVVLDEAHITNIAVHPDYRGQTIGDLLLTALEERARALGASRMTLEVRPSNLIAQSLYKKHGFETRGIRRGYYTDTNEDALVMWREL